MPRGISTITSPIAFSILEPTSYSMSITISALLQSSSGEIAGSNTLASQLKGSVLTVISVNWSIVGPSTSIISII